MQSVIDFPWSYKHCTDDVQVSAGPCVLHTITVNRLDTGTVVLTVRDNPADTGDTIAIINLTGTGLTTLVPSTLFYGVQCKTGLYIAFSGSPATADVTVTYK